MRLQLLRWLLIPLVVLLLVNAWFSNQVAIATANRAFDRLLEASADAIAEDVDVKDGAIVVDLPYAALQLLESNLQERIFYRVVGPNGATVTGYDDLPLPARSLTVEPEPAIYTAQYRDETIHLVALTKQIYGANVTSPVVVIVAETGEARYALSHHMLVEGLIRQALLIAAAGLLVWFGLVRGLGPLGRLTQSLARRDLTDLGPIDPSSVQVEVRPLIDALNQHTARIERLLASQRRLLTDASHQMRTPLAEISTQVEYSLRHQDPAHHRSTLADVHHDVGRLARLIKQWLLLARADREVLHDQRVDDVDLVELARAVTLEHVSAARKKAMDLAFDAPPAPTVVRGSSTLLREVVANLLDNAIAYGRRGGSVLVRVRHDAACSLEVVDDGPGIAASERERVFERFYRGGGAVGGSGLGLSIVRDICFAHHAHVELGVPAAGTGLVVKIFFQAIGSAQPA